MRIWADIYNVAGTLVGSVYTLTSVSVEKALDDIGNSSFAVPATDLNAQTLLQNEYTARLYVEHENVRRLLGVGVIQRKTVTASANGYTLNVSCVGQMKALQRKNVLLGRAYTNQALYTIAYDLVDLVSGWNITVEDDLGNQTARFDGVSVFKALLRLAEEKGLHIRDGATANTLELGAFGDDSGITAVAPMHNSNELSGNDNIVLIESIVEETNSTDVYNYIIPLGAGEGSAALTLKQATATGAYAIGSTTAPDGSLLYYLTDSTSVTTYGQNEKIVTFKEIGPVGVNSTLATTYASQALYDAAAAWLGKNKDPLVTYRMTVRKPRQVLQPGDKINVTCKLYVQTDAGEVVPIDLMNEPFWIMKVTERVSASGDSVDLQLASVDRYAKDSTKIIVDALESMQARNVAVNTFPVYWENTYSDAMSDGTSYSKDSEFRLYVNSFIADIIQVKLRIRTKPLWDATQTFFDVVSTSSYRTWQMQEGYNYPQQIGIRINSVDRTTALGGTWAATNAAVDFELDISDYIRNASGGLYQIHTVELFCQTVYGETALAPWTGHSNFYQSSGIAELSFNVFALARATIPKTT